MSLRWGARKGYAQEVYLNVYDLAQANDFIHPFGFGVYHSGVQIGNKEYTFAGGSGIFDHTPKEAPGAKFRESVPIGSFDGGPAAVNDALDSLRSEFGPDRYNVLSNNCNSFADAFLRELTGRPAPAWVNRLAWLGSWFSCCLPPEMLGEAPVQGGSGAGGVYQMVAPANHRLHSTQPDSFSAFGGSGATLGGSGGGGSGSGLAGTVGISAGRGGSAVVMDTAAGGDGTSSSVGGSGAGGADTLTDRRNKVREARLAALARAEAAEKH